MRISAWRSDVCSSDLSIPSRPPSIFYSVDVHILYAKHKHLVPARATGPAQDARDAGYRLSGGAGAHDSRSACPVAAGPEAVLSSHASAPHDRSRPCARTPWTAPPATVNRKKVA